MGTTEAEVPKARKSWGRALVEAVGTVVAIAVLFEGLTLLTGFPAPGAFRRYSAHDLTALADKLNAEPGATLIEGTSDVGQLSKPKGHASVDWASSRVVIDGEICLSDGAKPVSAAERAMLENPGDLKWCVVASTGGP